MSYKPSRFIGTLVLLVAVAPVALLAQSVDAPRFGDRIRVTTTGNVSVGRLTSLDTVAVVLRQKPLKLDGVLIRAASATIPMASVQKLEVSRGRRSRLGRTIAGGTLGLLSGALLTGAAGALASQCTNCDGDSGMGVLLAVPGGVLGLLIGGGIGYSTSPDRWESVALPGRASR